MNDQHATSAGPRPTAVLRYVSGESTAIYSGHGLLPQLGGLVAGLQGGAGRAVLCSDERVMAAQGEAARDALESAGLRVLATTMPAGEEQKHLGRVQQAYSALAAQAVERRDVIVALGGGVAGDLFGFVAATYLRGLRLVQVPTSIVAQVDSALGGKVGVDLPEGKNMVGAFKHAAVVLADYDLLATLPDEEWVAGTAEVAKHGVIADARLFELLESDPAAWRARRMPIAPVLDAAMRVKAHVVQVDEREAGLRMTLNYGHTLGHALETAAGYRGLRHGEAVAWGMAAAARLARDLGLSDQRFVERQDALLDGLGLLRPLPPLDPDAVYDRLFLDKKVAAGRIRWILPEREPGTVQIRDDVPLERVRPLLERTVAGTLLSA